MDANTKPTPTPEAAYESAHLVAQDLCRRISELLFDQPAPGNEDYPITWANVGTITEVNKRLSSVVAFLEGNDD